MSKRLSQWKSSNLHFEIELENLIIDPETLNKNFTDIVKSNN